MDFAKAVETIRALADLVSRQAGELQVLQAVVAGLLDELATNPRVSGAVARRMDEAYSSNLALSINVAEHEALSDSRDQFLGVMNAAALLGEVDALISGLATHEPSEVIQ